MKEKTVISAECAVAGAGAVGLAVARHLALSGMETCLIEKETAIGRGISSRSSEVMHAGMYYEPGSLKATLCIRGRAMLEEYCRARDVPFRLCGKVIVATHEAQMQKLQQLYDTGRDNGTPGLELIDRQTLLQLEPEVDAKAALFSPATGIFDSHRYMQCLHDDFSRAGGMTALDAPLEHGEVVDDGFLLSLGGREPCLVKAKKLVLAAGLDAAQVLRRLKGYPPSLVPTLYYGKGNYFALSGKSPFRRLVYPVPEAASLGIHATHDLTGQCRFGPDLEWTDDAGDLCVNENRKAAFAEAIRRYWPALDAARLSPAYAGIRPKLHGANPATRADYLIRGQAHHGISGLVDCAGIESPGLTSSLAIAEHVAGIL